MLLPTSKISQSVERKLVNSVAKNYRTGHVFHIHSYHDYRIFNSDLKHGTVIESWISKFNEQLQHVSARIRLSSGITI